jgi:hypothetical protein
LGSFEEPTFRGTVQYSMLFVRTFHHGEFPLHTRVGSAHGFTQSSARSIASGGPRAPLRTAICDLLLPVRIIFTTQISNSNSSYCNIPLPVSSCFPFTYVSLWHYYFAPESVQTELMEGRCISAPKQFHTVRCRQCAWQGDIESRQKSLR